MCGQSYFSQNGHKYSLFIGYFPGEITIDKKSYKKENKDELLLELNKLSKEELIQFIIGVIENGEEA